MITPARRFAKESENDVNLMPEGKANMKVEIVGRKRPPCCTCEKRLSGKIIACTHNHFDYEDPIHYAEFHVCTLSNAFQACQYMEHLRDEHEESCK